MIKNQSITLNGEKVTHVQSINISIDTPVSGGGGTYAPSILIERDATDIALATFFKVATNEDGRKNIITALLEFHGDDSKDDYKFDIKKGIVSRWSLTSGTNQPTTESIEIRAGEMSFNAGGKPADFSMPDFK